MKLEPPLSDDYDERAMSKKLTEIYTHFQNRKSATEAKTTGSDPPAQTPNMEVGVEDDAWNYRPEVGRPVQAGSTGDKMADRFLPRFSLEGTPESANKESRIDDDDDEEDKAIAPTGVEERSDQKSSRSQSLLSTSLLNGHHHHHHHHPHHQLTVPGPRGPATSLPPSPLLQPSDSSAPTSVSMSSLLERRLRNNNNNNNNNNNGNNKQRNISPLSLFDDARVVQCGRSKSQRYPSSATGSPKYDQVRAADVPLPSLSGQFPVRVLSDLYLGNAQTSADLLCLQRHNISYIVNVTSDVVNSFEDRPDFRYLRIPIADDSWSQDMEQHFRSAITFIDEGRKSKRSILIHCMAGVSRSVTVTVAYLMKSESLAMDDAYDHLRRCKSNINPNLSLMGQLQLFGEKLKAERKLKRLQSPQRKLPDFSSLSIDQAAAAAVAAAAATAADVATSDDRTPTTCDDFNPSRRCIGDHPPSSVLITPETATSFDSKGDGRVFNFPCTPPQTPSSRDQFGLSFGRAMSLPNGGEIDEF